MWKYFLLINTLAYFTIAPQIDKALTKKACMFTSGKYDQDQPSLIFTGKAKLVT